MCYCKFYYRTKNKIKLWIGGEPVDKIEMFKRFVDYIDTHPKEVNQVIEKNVDEWTKDFALIKDIGIGDTNIFVVPIPENKPVKIVLTENPCPINLKYHCENSKLEYGDGMQLVYKCKLKECCKNCLGVEKMNTCSKHYNDNVAYVNKLVRLLYDDLGEGCGGLLHIVLDDGNIEDNHIQWCIENANKEENQNRVDRYLSLEIAHKMLGLTIEQRKLVYYMDMCFECDGHCFNCVIENEEDDW